MGTKESGEHGCGETRAAILGAARARFQHYGFKKTTIDEIAADAGVGKGTVYLHFDSKDDILRTLALEVKRNVTEQMRAIAGSLTPADQKIRRMMLAAILSVHDAARTTSHGAELVDELLRPQISSCGQVERDRQIALIAQVLDDGARRGELALPDGDPRESATHLLLAMLPFFPPYFNPCHGSADCRTDLERRADAMLAFLLHGLRARA